MGRFLGNILWFILCGFWQGISWLLVGLLWCITIVGIPVGLQCFKLSRMYFFPFGKEIIYDNIGVGSTLLNIVWLIFGGLALALGCVISGILCCMTIIFIPFGLQSFKIARLALFPFGARIVYT